ncbi:carbon-nitrogen hydrolase family protein [Mycolicibacterium sp. 624]|uniref:carbon-nitrogen hydrolase family protein n=1 Tax=Mycolicibacterium sp. 624 TaxID=3156314 RepID=UPI0033987C81
MIAAHFQGPESGGEVTDHLNSIAAAARDAAAAGARILITPEMSVTGYDIGAAVAKRAERADGPIFVAIAELARQHGLAVVYGFAERVDDVIYNAVSVVDAEGRRIGHYRKTHLFGDLDRSRFAAGSVPVVQFAIGDLLCGLLICYDVEFPEAVRAHADNGTQWLIVPTGLMDPYGFVADTVIPARAYENQMFVSYVNRCGRERELVYAGRSCVYAPDGGELARADRTQRLLVCDLDSARLHRSRRVNTHLDDRRRNLYVASSQATVR